MKNKLYTGDNLYVLHGLNSESVDLIYLDPPFNSNRRFDAPIGSKAAGSSFEDMWTWDNVDAQYLEEMIQNYPFLVQFIQTIGKIHSNSMKSYITYMTQRIIEMKRVLKKNGSFYLHCDSTASHYLKIVCDRIFGKANFKNEIVWKRSFAHSLGSSHFDKVTDRILFYSFKDSVWNTIYLKHDEEYVRKFFRFKDKRGVYRQILLSGGKAGGKEAYQKWKGALPPSGRAWAPPTPRAFPKDIKFPENYKSLSTHQKLDVLQDLDLIVWSKNKIPNYKGYLHASKGKAMSEVVIDIPPLSAKSKEKTGYPTQKPLELVRRLILASSKEGDIILDPFCGCATTCVAAQQLNRKWIGIDISETSARIVIERLSEDAGLYNEFDHIKSNPKRTDIEEISDTSNVRETIYKNQKGKCNACSTEMDLRHFELDHIIPRAKGGGDYYENYQLLCSSCNRIKGDRPMAYLMMKIEKINKLMKYKVSFETGKE